jgi:hypothetical protein
VALYFVVLLFIYIFWRVIVKTIKNIFERRKKRKQKLHLDDDEPAQGGNDEA